MLGSLPFMLYERRDNGGKPGNNEQVIKHKRLHRAYTIQSREPNLNAVLKNTILDRILALGVVARVLPDFFLGA